MRASEYSAHASRQIFWVAFAATLLLKIVIAAGFPFTGDEAFFYQWGVLPAWGYSDHPPMVGWLIALLRQISDHPLVLRSATLLVTSLIALGVVDLLRRFLPEDREASAWFAGAVYLAMPWSWMFVLVTTDTPLVFFMALSAWCYLRADTSERGTGWYALAGLFLGLAFLSKYFAALLGFAYAAHCFGWRCERRWAPFLIFVPTLPAITLNVAFNATHGWSNVMFNVFNRNEGTSWSFETFGLYLVMVLYLLTPWLLWRGARARAVPGTSPATARTLAVLWLFPLVVFALLSTRRIIGLHWVLGFVPLFVLWVGLRLDARALRSALNWTMALSVPHLMVVAAIVWAPPSWWQPVRTNDRAVFLHETPAIVAALQKDLPTGATLMGRTYHPAAMLAFHHKQYVPVFGVGRHHARQDDQIIDFRVYDGRPIRIFLFDEPDPEEFAPYFGRISVKRFEVDGVAFFAVDGEGFRYQPFRDTVLTEVAREFHDIPRWLPLLGNPFCERYGFAACSPGRS
ncbi:MAG: glycosyltransferase family 39 protein [Hydrogenophaga sp.]|uniref:ArnT family glycosyltransferase n=1 Tax=Hydrogenophaga sp. TaxID=1904254 RepID=UPI00260AE65D|nr:glycosyltransferase family 39 protein [Hydrogenophaga sp.]MCV0437790.1 glycosyltransferase family 39 protein [Hydrogenophaga sp.]